VAQCGHLHSQLRLRKKRREEGERGGMGFGAAVGREEERGVEALRNKLKEK
jgi:hypothetical protein